MRRKGRLPGAGAALVLCLAASLGDLSCASSRKTAPVSAPCATPSRTPTATPVCARTPDPTYTPGPVIGYVSHVRPFFVGPGRCLDCHVGLFPASQYDLGTYAGAVSGRGDEARALNECDVVRGDASASYLVRKLEGGPGILGVQMPAGSPTVLPTYVGMVRQWIDQGCPP